MVPPKEYAELVGAKYQTVMLWLRSDLIVGACKYDLPTGGHYYLVPENAPKPVTQRGPKPKRLNHDDEDLSVIMKPVKKAAKSARKKRKG